MDEVSGHVVLYPVRSVTVWVETNCWIPHFLFRELCFVHFGRTLGKLTRLERDFFMGLWLREGAFDLFFFKFRFVLHYQILNSTLQARTLHFCECRPSPRRFVHFACRGWHCSLVGAQSYFIRGSLSDLAKVHWPFLSNMCLWQHFLVLLFLVLYGRKTRIFLVCLKCVVHSTTIIGKMSRI